MSEPGLHCDDDLSPQPDVPRHVLTAVEFDVLWERLGLGPTPVVLRLEPQSRTHAERLAVLAAGWQALRDRGLAGPGGPDPELTRLLHLLARPAGQLEMRASWGRNVRAVAAGRPGAGAVAVRQDATVALTPCTSLPSGLVAALPSAGAGTGRACTVPSRTMTAVLASAPERRWAVLAGSGVPAGEARQLVRMLDGTDRRARVVALAADRWEVLHRSAAVLAMLDGPRGRYALTRTTDESGVEWSTLAPADGRRLRQLMAELLVEATAMVTG